MHCLIPFSDIIFFIFLLFSVFYITIMFISLSTVSVMRFVQGIGDTTMYFFPLFLSPRCLLPTHHRLFIGRYGAFSPLLEIPIWWWQRWVCFHTEQHEISQCYYFSYSRLYTCPLTYSSCSTRHRGAITVTPLIFLPW